MRYLLLLLSFFIFSISANAQTQRAKEKFIKNFFNDFKKNRLDEIVDQFVDSILLDELITESYKIREESTKNQSREKIHKERAKAQKRFARTLGKAYYKFTTGNTEERLRNVKPEFEIYGEAKKPVPTFGIKYIFYLDDYEAELRINRILYDEVERRFVIMADNARSVFIPADLEVVEIKEIKEYESNDLTSEDVEMAIPEPTVREPKQSTPKVTSKVLDMPAPPTEVVEMDQELPEVVVEQEAFQVVEQMPEFPGGEKEMFKFITNNIQYPALAREQGVEGRVFVRFVVEKDGSLSGFKILRGIGGGCDQEAIRVLKKMPKWKPGKQRGKPVKVMFNLPFSFKLR